MQGCKYVIDIDMVRFPSDSTYEPEPRTYLTEGLLPAINSHFNVTETTDISFLDLYGYCD